MILNIYWNRGNKSIKLNQIVKSAQCEKSSDSVGSLTLVIDREKTKDFDFAVGDNIIIPFMDDARKTLFYGKVFKIAYSDTDEIELTAYDILKYFQGKKYNVFPSIDLGSIIKVMCSDLEVEYGYLEKTPNCKAKLYTDKSYGDILQEYQDYLLYTNNVKYVHRVENNAIALRNLQNLLTNYLITDDITESYSYTESAEDVINVVEVVKKNDSTGEITRYVTGDKDSINKLGVLVTSISADEDDSWDTMVARANNQLFINKQYNYDLTFTLSGLALLNIYDVLKTKINGQANVGYIDNISWDLVDETTEISLVLLGK